MISTEQFKEWLDNESQSFLAFKKGNTFYSFLKAPKTGGFYYLYKQRNYVEDFLRRNNDFEYSGIYYPAHGVIYDCRETTLFPDLVHEASIDQMKKSVTEQVQRRVFEIINGDRANLHVTRLSEEKQIKFDSSIESEAEENAKRLFLQGVNNSEIPSYICLYQFTGWSENNLLQYIREPSPFIEREAEEYIEAHQEDILWDFLKNDRIRAAMKRMEACEDSPLHRLRNIMTAMKDLPVKTVKVTVNKEGIECSFKTEAEPLRRAPFKSYSTWNMLAADRRNFEAIYGRHADYKPEDIIHISYRGSTIYTAEPYEPECCENEEITINM